ncbi:Mu transposase domain-containing protein [Streptomyces sp. NPDC001156]
MRRQGPTISVESVRYSVPHQLVEASAWVRFHGDELIVTAIVAGNTIDVARHLRSTRASLRSADEHHPGNPRGERTPPRDEPRQGPFPAISPGAAAWPVEPRAAGVRRIRAKRADADALAKLHRTADLDRTLGAAATVSRLAESDLRSIQHQQGEHDRVEQNRHRQTHSLQPGTPARSGITTP